VPRRSSLLFDSLFGDAMMRGDIAAFLIQDDQILAVNDAAARLTGYEADEMIALSIERLAGTPPEERPERREGSQAGIGRLRRKDGEITEVAYLAGATTLGNRPAYLALAWDTQDSPQSVSMAESWLRWVGAPGQEGGGDGPGPGEDEPPRPPRPSPRASRGSRRPRATSRR
jgi:PAS domain S-box-containing protein